MKKEIFALTLSAVMAAGTCSIPVMAADDTYNVGICQLVQHELLMLPHRALKTLSQKNSVTRLLLTNRTHRATPIPVLLLSIILFLMMWI